MAKTSVKWDHEIKGAQEVKTYSIKNREYSRVPYGSERQEWEAEKRSCHDCGVRDGQLHVPGCDVEQCPRCHGQAITCACNEE